jgi:hypothetical protein
MLEVGRWAWLLAIDVNRARFYHVRLDVLTAPADLSTRDLISMRPEPTLVLGVLFPRHSFCLTT